MEEEEGETSSDDIALRSEGGKGALMGKNSCSFCASLDMSVTMRPALSSCTAPDDRHSVLRYMAAMMEARQRRPSSVSMMRSWDDRMLYTTVEAAK